jgi:hypothetical protein
MRTLTVWAGSVGLDPAALVSGQDLVLEPALAHGLSLPPGTVVDDHLDRAGREAVDARALELSADWAARHAAELRVEGVDLGWIWQVELYASIFQLAARLEAALALHRPERVVARGFGGGRLGHVAHACRAVGAELEADASGHGLAAEIPFGRDAAWARALVRVARTVGVPGRVRSDIVCLQYWHLMPVIDRLTGIGHPPAPVGVALRGIPPRRIARAAATAGWTGLSGTLAQRRAAEAVRAQLGSPDPRTLDGHALTLVAERGSASIADVRAHRRTFARDRPRLALLPWDSPDIARSLLVASREVGATSLVVQHGFDARLGDPDKHAADHAALWDARDAAGFAADRGGVRVTGNPGASHLADVVPSRPASDRILLLVEYPARLSSRIPARIALRHTDAALTGIAQARPGATVVVRPHPSDQERDAYVVLAARHPGVRVELDATTPIEPLAKSCGLCVGGLSTATLQAAVLGIPSVVLDVAETPLPWPFDGAPDALPRATSADELAALLGGAVQVAAREAALEALGVRPDARDAVVAYALELAGG